MLFRSHAEHFKTYGHKAEGEPVELVAIRVIATVPSDELPERLAGWTPATDPGFSRRPAYFGAGPGTIDTPVSSRARLAGQVVPGPLIVEEYDATVLVPPGAEATVDEHNNIIITLGAQR